MEYTHEQLSAAPSMRGKFTKAVKLTDFELAVAKHQGLIGADGNLLPAAFKPTEKQTLETVPIDTLVDDPGGLEEQLQNIRRAARSGTETEAAPVSAVVDPTLHVDKPLDAPGVIGSTDLTQLTPAQLELALRSASTPVHCPHCNYDQRAMFQEPECSPEDKAAFIRHIFSRGRFLKAYTLFDGAITVRFRSRTPAETAAIHKHVRNMLKANDMGASDLIMHVQRLLCANAVESITSGDDTVEYKQLSSTDSPEDAYEAVFGGQASNAMYMALFSVFLEFDRLYDWLTSRAQDSNFWKTVPGSRS